MKSNQARKNHVSKKLIWPSFMYEHMEQMKNKIEMLAKDAIFQAF